MVRMPFVLAEAPSHSEGPNIILITLDTVRGDHLSAYGYSRPTTPNLDRLAEQGVLFEKAYAPSSWTLPSHASMFTGLLPHQHGANSEMPLDPGLMTLAEVLGRRGYETAGFSSNIGYGQKGWGLAQGFEYYDDDRTVFRYNLALTLTGRTILQPIYQDLFQYDLMNRRPAAQLNEDVFRWYRKRSGRPFFLFINYIDAHDPYLAPPPFDRRFGKLSDSLMQKMGFGRGVQVPRKMTPSEQQALIDGYDNCLAYLDREVGNLITTLAASPEWKNTYVMITSDHGEAFGEHGMYGHGWDVHHEVLHVPLLIWGPGVPSGVRIKHVARMRELFPTSLDLTLGQAVPFSRISLRRFWTPGFRPEAFDEIAVSEVSPPFPQPGRPSIMSAVNAEWQYIQSSYGVTELYYLPSDPEGQRDLSKFPEYASVTNNFRQELCSYTVNSIKPWLGPEYVAAVGGPEFRPASGRLSCGGSTPPLRPSDPSVGVSQAFFTPRIHKEIPRPADQELIRSLPYH